MDIIYFIYNMLHTIDPLSQQSHSALAQRVLSSQSLVWYKHSTNRGGVMRNRNMVGVMVVAACLAGAMIAQANLIVNGSFEDGNFYPTDTSLGWYSGNGWTAVCDNSTLIDGWTVEGRIDWHDITGAFELKSKDGVGGQRAVDLTPSAGSAIWQSFATVIGQYYTLSFTVASPSLFYWDNFESTVTVNLAGSYTQPGQPQTNYVPTLITTGFTATDTTTTLKFSGSNQGNQWWSPVIDDVSVTATTVPDGGTTIALLGAAMLGLAGLRRKISV